MVVLNPDPASTWGASQEYIDAWKAVYGPVPNIPTVPEYGLVYPRLGTDSYQSLEFRSTNTDALPQTVEQVYLVPQTLVDNGRWATATPTVMNLTAGVSTGSGGTYTVGTAGLYRITFVSVSWDNSAYAALSADTTVVASLRSFSILGAEQELLIRRWMTLTPSIASGSFASWTQTVAPLEAGAKLACSVYANRSNTVLHTDNYVTKWQIAPLLVTV